MLKCWNAGILGLRGRWDKKIWARIDERNKNRDCGLVQGYFHLAVKVFDFVYLLDLKVRIHIQSQRYP